MCLLNRHPKGYRLSTPEALQSILTPPYAARHFELSKPANKTSTEHWGHRIIAIVECIPLVGAFVSLIERIVSLVCNWLQKSSKPPIRQQKPINSLHINQRKKHSITSAPSNIFNNVPGDLVGHLSKFLAVSEAGSLAALMDEVERNRLWKGQAEALKLKVPRGEKPIKVVKDYIDKSLIDFCSLIPQCAAQIESIKKSSSEIGIQAALLRQWLKSAPEIAFITMIDLEKKNIKEIPPEICFFKNLDILNLRNNQISKIPKEIGDLKKLKFLYLEINRISIIPREIGNLKELKDLHLQKNRISEIPKEIGGLKELKYLYLGINRISNIPKEIADLERLSYLGLKGNPIKEFHEEVKKLLRGRPV